MERGQGNAFLLAGGFAQQFIILPIVINIIIIIVISIIIFPFMSAVTEREFCADQEREVNGFTVI